MDLHKTYKDSPAATRTDTLRRYRLSTPSGAGLEIERLADRLTGREAVDAYCEAASAYSVEGKQDGLARSLEKACQAFGDEQDPRVLLTAVQPYLEHGDTFVAEAIIDVAVTHLSKAGDVPGLGECLARYGTVRYYQQRFLEAAQLHQAALGLYSSAPSHDLFRAFSLSTIGLCLFREWRKTKQLSLLENADSAFKKAEPFISGDNVVFRAKLSWHKGDIALALGHPKAALNYFAFARQHLPGPMARASIALRLVQMGSDEETSTARDLLSSADGPRAARALELIELGEIDKAIDELFP